MVACVRAKYTVGIHRTIDDIPIVAHLALIPIHNAVAAAADINAYILIDGTFLTGMAILASANSR